ncbi:MAG: rplY [Rickettsiaceae bacterium]|jgi:large subunit ribosomal protein L25|nr:rplY [Rickettsiaceae bacterium]
MTSNFNLKANLRSTLGSAYSRRARKAGQLPAVVHGKNGENLNILVDVKEFEHQYFKGNILTSVVEIELDGKKISAIPHKIELDPVTDRPIHVDFIPFTKGEIIQAKTKIKFINQDKSPGLKRGGFLHVVLRKVAILCKSDVIPEVIEVDIASARVGAKIKGSDLKLPNGVELAKKNEFIIASIIGRGSKDDEDKAAPGAEGAAPADAKAAPAAKAPAGEKKEAEKKPAAKK